MLDNYRMRYSLQYYTAVVFMYEPGITLPQEPQISAPLALLCYSLSHFGGNSLQNTRKQPFILAGVISKPEQAVACVPGVDDCLDNAAC